MTHCNKYSENLVILAGLDPLLPGVSCLGVEAGASVCCYRRHKGPGWQIGGPFPELALVLVPGLQE